VVLYELLTGHLPFTGENPAAVIHAILHQPPTPIQTYREVPPTLAFLIDHALEKHVENRSQSFQDIHDDLLRISRGTAQISNKKRRRTTGIQARIKTPKLKRMITGAALLLLIGIAAVLLVQHFRTSQKPPMNIVQLTTSAGESEGASFSPDGNQIAYHWGGEANDNSDIYIQQISTHQILRLTTNPAQDIWPAWSPDGQQIAFCRWGNTAEETGIYLISSLGGTERKIYSKYCTNPSWSPDGRQLVFFDFQTGNINILNLASEESRSLTIARANGIPNFILPAPELSPDGKFIAYVQLISFSVSDIFLIPSTGGKPRQITHDRKLISGLTWTADGKHIVFSSNRATSQKLWSVRRDGSGLKLLEASGQNSLYPAISRDGHRLAFSESHGGNVDIGRIKVTGDQQAQWPEKFILSQKDELFLNFSPDGRKGVFYSNQTGFNEIWTCDANGKNLLQLTTLNTHCGTPLWSPDGNRIIFDCRFTDNSDIFVIAGDGGNPLRLTSDPSDEILPSWSSDGAWIYYTLLDKGRGQIWKMPAAGGTPVQVTRNGGYVAFEAPDGRSLYYFKLGSPHIWRCGLSGENETLVVESIDDYRVWSVYPEGIYFLKWNPADGLVHVHLYDLTTKKIKTLAVLGAVSIALAPMPSPDRQWIYLTYKEKAAQSDIILVENF
jgi:Tol biopolymer transport system component